MEFDFGDEVDHLHVLLNCVPATGDQIFCQKSCEFYGVFMKGVKLALYLERFCDEQTDAHKEIFEQHTFGPDI